MLLLKELLMIEREYSLKGFTLLESIVALLVSSIIIFTLFSILLIANNFVGKYRSYNKEVNDLILFSSYLQGDCNKTRLVNAESTNSIILHRDDYDVNYLINPNFIVRITNFTTDTFHLYSKNIYIDSGSIKSRSVFYMSLDVLLQRDTIPLLFSVKYTNRDVINANF